MNNYNYRAKNVEKKKTWAAIQLLVLPTGLALTESSMDTVNLTDLEVKRAGKCTKISLGFRQMLQLCRISTPARQML